MTKSLQPPDFAALLVELLGLQGKAVGVPARRNWASPQDVDRHSFVVRSGLFALYREQSSGQRRLVALRYPGEFIAPHEEGLAITAWIASDIVSTSSSAFFAGVQAGVHLRRAFEGRLKRSQLIAYEWLMRDAFDSASRLAHFLCEHGARLGLSDRDDLPLDFTQAQLAEITAQTAVNVNRILQSFSKQQILRPAGKRTYHVDWPELKRRGRFNPRYLEFPL